MHDPAEILRAWGLQGADCALVARRENHVFRVETPAGPAALRLHRAGYRSRAELQSELDWMAALARGGMHVPAPLPTLSGALCIEEGGVLCDMLTWLEGEPMGQDGRLVPLDDAPGTYRTLGVEMARLHDISDRWTTPDGFTRPAWDMDGLLGEEPLWGRFWENPLLGGKTRALFEDTRRTARKRLAAAGGTLDFGLIHADLVPENVLVEGARLALIDFDDAGRGFRAFDLATAMNRALREAQPQRLMDALLDGYSSRRHPDTDALPLFQVLRALTYVGWIVPRLEEPGAAARAERFIAMAERMARRFLNDEGGFHA